MITVATILDLFAHMQWADAAVWKAVLALPAATEDAKLQEVLYHLHVVQRAFLKAWRGESFEDGFPKFSDARSLQDWARGYYAEVNTHLDNLDEDSLKQPMPLPWAAMVEKRFGRTPEITTVGETALQVALHTAYHRGQVNARLRELGGEPPLVDYIAWLWQGRPAADWN
ncbi:MAG: DinB family protein [Acidobacteria bacterium]|nr:DinB family protein [Acidobacteriota bacterium]